MTTEVVRRRTTTVPPVVKSESAGLVQARSTMVLPGVAVEEVTPAGDVLSIVRVFAFESEPTFVLEVV